MSHNPFDTIESAHEYVRMLKEEVEEVRIGVENDALEAIGDRATRRVEALHLVDYKLKRLAQHLDASSRILNDLRLLQRLLTRTDEGISSREQHPSAASVS